MMHYVRTKKSTNQQITRRLASIFLGIAVLSTSAPNGLAASGSKSDPSAMVENAITENQLAVVTLTPHAETRLGIETVISEFRPTARILTLPGVVTVPPGRRFTVYAASAGTIIVPGVNDAVTVGKKVTKKSPLYRLLRLAAERDALSLERDRLSVNQEGIKMSGNLAIAESQLKNAHLKVSRAERLLMDKAGSQRAVDEARAELEQADAAAVSAREQLRLYNDDTPDGGIVDEGTVLEISSPVNGTIENIYVAEGQTIASGAPLFEVANYDVLWVRVPVYAGDAHLIDTDAAVNVQTLYRQSGADAITVRPVMAPPSADPAAATVDFFYELPNSQGRYRPGEKLSVAISLPDRQSRITIPYSAILYDIHGGSWIYENISAHKFARRRVVIDHVIGESAVLAHGPGPGVNVVTSGAAELFGTEFGVGK